MKKIISIILTIFLVQNYCAGQVLYINDVDISVGDATTLYAGDSVMYVGDTSRLLVHGFGSNFIIKGNFNNASANKKIFDIRYDNLDGIITMGGASQSVNGFTTLFPNLVLSGGQKIKSLNTHIEVARYLDLEDCIMDANNHTIKMHNADTNAIGYDLGGYINTSLTAGKNGWLIRNVNPGDRYVYPVGDENHSRIFRPLVLTADQQGDIWGQFQNYDPSDDNFPTIALSPTLKREGTTLGNKYFYGLRLNDTTTETTINLGLPFDSHDVAYTKMVQWDSLRHYWDSLPSDLFSATPYLPNDKELYARNFTLTGLGQEKIIGMAFGEYIPPPPDIGNVITPNGDGINDWFNIKGLEGVYSKHLTIFNRWQSVVYDKNPYDNTASDGWTAAGLNPGTYFYVLTGTDSNGKKVERRGYIEVIK